MKYAVCCSCGNLSNTRKERNICRNTKYHASRKHRRKSYDKIECNTCHMLLDKDLMLLDSNRCKKCQVLYRKSLRQDSCIFCKNNSKLEICKMCKVIRNEMSDDVLFQNYMNYQFKKNLQISRLSGVEQNVKNSNTPIYSLEF
jgi:hypothetical protein